MMFGVHGGEEVGGGFVLGLILTAAPVHEEAVTKAPEQADDAHGLREAHAAEVIEMGHIQALMEAALNTPSLAVELEPLGGIELFGRQTGHQGDGFRRVVTQMAAQERYLFDAGELDLLRAGGHRAQDAPLQVAFVEFTAGRQSWRGLLRGENHPAKDRPTSQYWRGRWADCL